MHLAGLAAPRHTRHTQPFNMKFSGPDLLASKFQIDVVTMSQEVFTEDVLQRAAARLLCAWPTLAFRTNFRVSMPKNSGFVILTWLTECTADSSNSENRQICQRRFASRLHRRSLLNARSKRIYGFSRHHSVRWQPTQRCLQQYQKVMARYRLAYQLCNPSRGVP